ncbi:unnamed protein product [Rotaria sp. Silwood2]|nr:unnamed protein product [Rotaria sp. Silwood2]CAF3996956.1 unnamed protein product [Rotaria sp. Silwood2]CAF4002880.1 unnamed protein product [Rotaria sp. Silwood2]CAF4226221.1 unnamed protein product [Rotaria sp. Silwood2]
MLQAFESSIQTLNKARRLNLSIKKRAKNATTVQPVRRPTCSIAELMRKTNFSKDEIRHLYRRFKQDCPSGEVSKAHFSSVFSTLFPGGAFVFRNIDRSNFGYIRFEDLIVTLSTLIHGSVEDRLGWIFDLYDINKDGMLTKMELSQIVASIFQLIIPVCKLNFTAVSNAIEERTDQLFQNWDTHRNGFVNKEDFLRYCLQVCSYLFIITNK